MMGKYSFGPLIMAILECGVQVLPTMLSIKFIAKEARYCTVLYETTTSVKQ